ncbi:helix-turn-helix domain-containing protein [Polycladidibacter hongkongensis]|uniref:helix-turn-helix domain-containing protein n=1 Tax=Polycladidibacter hongkongensis TaxID=1647556 RepID=UPI000835B6FD|nr:helix-turn-helix transcriptional regulator [Pseudovibrio hongkongensis]
MDSNQVKNLRERLGWSQSDMAMFLGVKQPTVFRMEQGSTISGPTLRLLCLLQAQVELTHAAKAA